MTETTDNQTPPLCRHMGAPAGCCGRWLCDKYTVPEAGIVRQCVVKTDTFLRIRQSVPAEHRDDFDQTVRVCQTCESFETTKQPTSEE